MSSSVRDAWAVIVRQATALDAHERDVDRTVAALGAAGDRLAADRTQLAELDELVDQVLALPSTGPRVVTVTPRQSKRVRAEAVTGLWELGRAHIVGRLPLLEAEAQSWNPDGGGRSPNRVDVMAHLLTHLDTGRRSAVAMSRGTMRVPSGVEGREQGTSARLQPWGTRLGVRVPSSSVRRLHH